jgi:hypothetical protein
MQFSTVSARRAIPALMATLFVCLMAADADSKTLAINRSPAAALPMGPVVPLTQPTSRVSSGRILRLRGGQPQQTRKGRPKRKTAI